MKHWVVPLSERIAKTAPLLDVRSPRDYLDRVIRPKLLGASDRSELAVGPQSISRHVRLDARSRLVQGASDLVGGRRNFDRNTELADLLTPDGGWLFFAAILRPAHGSVEVVAYNIERVYAPDHHPRWVRFDYNEPGHDNDQRGLRAHFHPGNDDIQLPSPIFAPHELIDALLTTPRVETARKARIKGGKPEGS